MGVHDALAAGRSAMLPPDVDLAAFLAAALEVECRVKSWTDGGTDS
jgi:hypothetical protein